MNLTGRIGENYEIVTPLGAGAMGEVYRGVDRKMFDRPVAIKVLASALTGSDEGRARFRREVETSARLHHPNIVTIYDWGEHQGRDFFVMEFVDGRDLQGLLKSGVAWDLEQRLQIAFQVADALDFAHRAGVIHRDIKPGNVMVADSESGARVKLVDFGIAHVERSSLTQAQSHPGTFSYMSPEQLRSDEIDPRSDLFSLGIVFGELFTGHHPFEARSEALVSGRILGDAPDPPRKHVPDLPPELDALIVRMLERDRDERPASAREVAEVLRELSRKAVARSVAADPTVTALDDLERGLVESLLTWARQKEADGALADALAAYEKAMRLAPDSESIRRKASELEQRTGKRRELEAEILELERHLEANRPAQARETLRKAWALGEGDPRLSALESRLAELEATSPEIREREEFVAPRMRAVETFLESGKIAESSALLTEILRRYPDQSEAVVLLDRLMELRTGGVEYGNYREALREARAALESGDPDGASASVARARGYWPSGPEIEGFESEIAAAREAARRRAADIAAAKRREEEERARREREVLERYVEMARSLLAEARAIQPVSAAETRRALEAFGKAVRTLDLVLADRPDHTTAGEARREALYEIGILEKGLGVPEPPPRQERRPATRRTVEREEAPPKPRGRRALVAAAVAIGVIGIAIAAFALRPKPSEPFAKEVEEVLGLPEGSEREVAVKLERVHAIDALLPGGDARKTDLALQGERLVTLHEMYVVVERLEALRDEAVGPGGAPGGPAKLRSDAANVWRLLEGYRSELPPDDPTAKRVEERGRSILSEIEN